MQSKKRSLPDESFEKNLDLPKAEEKILEFWRTHRIFEKSLDKRRDKKTFVFYEGPPYANGKPGIHHVLARIVKDVILRYKTMRGYFVPRKAGWDTHGLPVEIAAEKALGIKSKKEIEKLGIEAFNEKAKEQVWVYKDEWEQMTERIGYWLDLKNAYVTYRSDYIETLWWILKTIGERKLLYKGHKVVPWCPRCGTALSSHELAQGYEEVTEDSVYVKFKLTPRQKKKIEIQKPQESTFSVDNKTYILSWTTTPWTLPGNVALAIKGDLNYVLVKHKDEKLFIAESLAEKVLGKDLQIEGSLKGGRLIDLEYEPLFNIPQLRSKESYKVYDAGFVNTDEGTGVVHTAVMYGEDDYQLGTKVGLPQHHTVTEDGKFTKEAPGLAGLPVKAKETEAKIFKILEENRNLLRIEKYTHEYPFCWRCETPVIYYARTSWFIGMSRLRKKLIENNKKINWAPPHLKEGRFGEWIREAKDWNLSRERYWGAPLPVWECKKCGATEVVGSLEELSRRSGGSKNKYWVMRHGQSETQLKRVIDSGEKPYHLTATGRMQAEATAQTLRREKIDLIISSDIPRTKETAKIVAEVLGKKIIFEPRLREINLPTFAGCHSSEYHRAFPTLESRFEKRPEKGESLRDLRARMWNVLQDLEKKYRGKRLLLISHEYPLWMLFHAAAGWTEAQAIVEKINSGREDFIDVGETRKFPFLTAPRNRTGEVDLHRPWIDKITFPCERCRGTMERIPEVADVWFDSGAMPYAQAHWPFAQYPASTIKHPTPPKEYPADYIAEGMDQTRGWFYTLLAVSTALGYGAPYKNVISLGLINDKFGQKMSKSKGNIVEPFSVIQKYGVDAVRWYFYTVNPLGETKNFDEAEVLKAFRRFHLIIWNSFLFFKTYASPAGRGVSAPRHVLDKWISARLNETVGRMTASLESYDIRDAALTLETFTDDLSRWYIRRSRRRLQKPESEADYRTASSTLGFALKTLCLLAAPFTPFFAEALYQRFGKSGSVHLAEWPKSKKSHLNEKLISRMANVRRFASAALAKRAELGIKVRQPLRELKIRGKNSDFPADMREILADEVNVKSVTFDGKLKAEIELDTTVTPELREEGILREAIRVVQDLRQKAGFRPADKIVLMCEVAENTRSIFMRNEKILKEEVSAKEIEYRKSGKYDAETSTKLDEANVWIGVRRV